jgi:glyoxylase I family protein
VSGGLPGLRRGDHVGVVVPDLDAALALFVDVLGGSCLVRHGPYRGRPDDPGLQERQFARHPRTEVEGIAMVRVADTVVELLQFSAPDQRREVPRTSDLGGHHLAFYVDDMPAAIEHLRSHGVRVLGEPMPLPGPEAGDGALFVFALTGWGLALELVTYPNGKAWQQGRPPVEQAPPARPGGER